MDVPVFNLDELEPLARERLDQGVFDYIAGGADDEVTLRLNRVAFRRLLLRPRILRDVRERDLTSRILDLDLSMPVILAPTALQRMAHDEGERAVARAAGAAGVIQCLSTVSSVSLEDVAAVGSPRWFQLYVYQDHTVAETLVRRAEDAGYSAIVLTVDLALLGRRERDLRNVFMTPPGVLPANLIELMETTTDLMALLTFDAGLTFDSIDWLRSLTSLPIVIKGVARGDDAASCIEHGAAAIWVSNHGGRQLDTAVPTADALPEVVASVAGRVPVIVDGGIRRGTDVVKALALGASAVAIGRPHFYGLAVGGEAGVTKVLDLLRDEISLAMALAGAARLDDLDTSLLAR